MAKKSFKPKSRKVEADPISTKESRKKKKLSGKKSHPSKKGKK